MSTPESFIEQRGRRRRVGFDPTEPMYDGGESPEPYTGEPAPDYFAGQNELSARDHVDSDPTAAARRRDLPPPYAGALEMSHDDGGMWTLPAGDDETTAVAKGALPPASASSTAHMDSDALSQLDRDRAEYDALAADPYPNKHRGSRWGAIIQNALYTLSRNAQSVSEGAARSGRPVDMYGIANVIGGGIGGAVAGAARPGIIEQRQREQRLHELEGHIKFQLGVEKAHADYTAKLAQADYTRQRAPLERLKREGTQLDRDRRALLSMYRTVGEYDPSDHRFDSMGKEAERLGVTLQPYKRGEKPPQRFNHLGRVWEYLKDDETNEYYARPVADDDGQALGVDTSKVPDEHGLLPAQAAADDDRDRAFGAAERQRAVSNDLRRAGLALSGQRLDLSRAQFDNRLSEQTRKELKTANDLAAESERYQQAANDMERLAEYKDPDTGEVKQSKGRMAKRAEYLSRAASLRQKLAQNYGYIFGDGKMSTEDFQRMFPNVTGNIAGEAYRLGFQLTDPGIPQQAPKRSPLPQRSAPASPGIRPRASKPSAGEDPNVRAYADAYFGGDYGKAQATIEEQRKRRR
jgi:hypothetical protein